MADAATARKYIRFALSTLSEANEHHRFEALCFDVTKRRIASNVMPATGPVGAGGDQGRDAESYWTALGQHADERVTSFARLATSEKVVVACSLQAEKIGSKIATDVANIVSKGDKVDRVIFFTSGSLAVGKRHSLQEEMRELHQVELDVWDALALSSALGDHDLFDLAIEHLDVPAALAPSPVQEGFGIPEWYGADRDRWCSPDAAPESIGDLVDLTPGLRHASYNPALRGDLDLWIASTRRLAEHARDYRATWSARYEIVWATLRGRDSIRGVERDLRYCMERAIGEDSDDVAILEGAVLLLDLGYGTWLDGVSDLARTELESWHAALIDVAERLLAADPFPNRRAMLLAIVARLQIHQRYPDPLPRERDRISMANIAADRVRPDGSLRAARFDDLSMPAEMDLRDRDAGFVALVELSRVLEQATLYPVTGLADIFNLLSPYLADHPDYEGVRDALDHAVERSSGRAARAAKSVGRAKRFLEQERWFAALHEVHDAKINWWSGETLESAIDMLLLASAIYSRLNLPLAAKHYALAAAAAAHGSTDMHLGVAAAAGFAAAGRADHEAGQTATSLKTFYVATLIQSHYSDDPWNQERHPFIEGLIVTQAIVHRLAADLRPTLLPMVESALAESGVLGVARQWLEETSAEDRYSEDAVCASADADGAGRPFSDLGPVRRYEWHAHGLPVTLRCANLKSDVLATERFGAALQIVLAEFATRDGHFLSSPLCVEVAADLPLAASPLESITSREEGTTVWRRLSLSPEGHTADEEVFAAVIGLLFEQSVLNPEDFSTLLEGLAERGLFHKLLSGNSYEQLADYIPEDEYLELSRVDVAPIGSGPRNWNLSDGPMPARHDEASIYPSRREGILLNIAYRYETIPRLLNRTLPMLNASTTFRETLIRLRDAGWKDWHVLVAVAGVAMNARAERRGFDFSDVEAVKRAFRGLYDEPETPEEALEPDSSFDENTLQMHLRLGALAGIQTNDLSLDLSPAPTESVMKFLAERFHYWDEDVPHHRPFDGGL